MKKCLIIIFVFSCTIIIVGCNKNEPTKMIKLDYITKNNGITFNKYALAIDSEENDRVSYAVFKENSNDIYIKLFVVKDYSKDDRLLATDKYLYVFYSKGGFIGYDLNSTSDNIKKVEPKFEEIDGLIYYPVKVYGFSGDFIYISYYKDEITKEILYAKIKSDLSSYQSLKSEELIPTDIDNYISK